MDLTDDDQAILSGRDGEGAATALRLVVEAARLLGAPRLLPVASAHIDGCLYHGDAGVAFAEMLVARTARVRVPSTLNVGALDLLSRGRERLDPHRRSMALRLMQAYQALGCTPSWTCAPYQAGHRPQVGQDVAWGESNAVAFCNSVLGARTNRYGDFLDIACAIAGRAPATGLHLTANRRATVVVRVEGVADAVRHSEAFWPVLGAWYGRVIGDRIGVVTGMEDCADEDRLKAFGAAAASYGAVALFHIAGVTPEAPDDATATAGGPVEEILRFTAADLPGALALLSTASGDQVDAVAVGSPHLSVAECHRVLALLAGRRVAVPFYANTGRHVVTALEADGSYAGLVACGVTVVADTCIVVTPIVDPGEGRVLLTNSGKFAHYAPGNIGYGVQFGTLEDCVESAVAGRLVRLADGWRQE